MREYKVLVAYPGESCLNQLDSEYWELVSALKMHGNRENQATLAETGAGFWCRSVAKWGDAHGASAG